MFSVGLAALLRSVAGQSQAFVGSRTPAVHRRILDARSRQRRVALRAYPSADPFAAASTAATSAAATAATAVATKAAPATATAAATAAATATAKAATATAAAAATSAAAATATAAAVNSGVAADGSYEGAAATTAKLLSGVVNIVKDAASEAGKEKPARYYPESWSSEIADPFATLADPAELASETDDFGIADPLIRGFMNLNNEQLSNVEFAIFSLTFAATATSLFVNGQQWLKNNEKEDKAKNARVEKALMEDTGFRKTKRKLQAYEAEERAKDDAELADLKGFNDSKEDDAKRKSRRKKKGGPKTAMDEVEELDRYKYD